MSPEGAQSYSEGCSPSLMEGNSPPSPEGAASVAELQIPLYRKAQLQIRPSIFEILLSEKQDSRYAKKNAGQRVKASILI
jgi:hypothetical protein